MWTLISLGVGAALSLFDLLRPSAGPLSGTIIAWGATAVGNIFFEAAVVIHKALVFVARCWKLARAWNAQETPIRALLDLAAPKTARR